MRQSELLRAQSLVDTDDVKAPDVNVLMGAQLCGDADYEKWSVPTPERCLLGRNITMTRRKADAACFNGKGWERPEGLDNLCDCTTVGSCNVPSSQFSIQ